MREKRGVQVDAIVLWIERVIRLAIPLCLLAAGSAHADLYSHWPLDDGSGEEARNMVATGDPGIIYDADLDGLGPDGSVWVEDAERGTVLGLGGNTAWVQAGYLPMMDLENDFSWAFWARQHPNQATPSNDIVIGNRYDDAGQNTVPREFIKFTPRQFEYHMDSAFSDNMRYAPDNDIPSYDVWMHHALVKVGTELTYFRNGEIANTGELTQSMLSPDPFPFYMGGQDGRETWAGYLSNVQLYESGLTGADIQTVMMSNDSLAGKGLYGHWPLDDGAGDEAANLAPGTDPALIWGAEFGGLGPDGSVWVDDPERGTVIGFSGSDTAGSNAWVEAGYLPMMTDENDFTWTFWARQAPGQATPANDIIIGNRWGDNNVDTAPREFIKFTPNQFEFHMNGAAAGNVQYSPATDSETGIPSNDEWIHHVVVKDGEELTYYRNGEVANQGMVTREMLSADPFPFAMGGQNGVETWQGYLSDVRLFDHSLTPEEISAIIGGGVRGDYNGNGELDAEDLDWQAEVLLGLRDYEDQYDETGDGQATEADRAYWLAELKKTWVGDSNFDSKFDTADLVQVLSFGKYETGENAGWAEGDWTGNLTFDTGDLVAALGAGGYEQGPFSDDGNVATVPEPGASVLLILGMLGWLSRARRE